MTTDSSTTQQLPDPRPVHRQAMTQTESIVAAVEPGQLGNPTPCAEYDVRALLSHIVGGLNRVAIAGEGGDALARPARADDVPDDGWLAAYRAAATRAAAAWTDDAKLDALVELPWGKIPGRFAIAGYIQEVLTPGPWPEPGASCRPRPGERTCRSAPWSRSHPTRAPTPSSPPGSAASLN
jgi:hypothetical protein